ncbi:MAG TPA: hypothetical protein VFR15_05465 [Chloroflexia bacterium]|nr:hypothetical protein [Chloroflexia bacterium]
MTTGNIFNDIFIIWLPIVFALLLAALGAIRGVRRESIVALSIVLGGLILMVWGQSWATDLSDVIPNLSVADWQVALGYVVMGLVVLAAGYGLASALTPRGAPTPLSRLGGFLLGLANGAAIVGWIMRNHYIALRDSGAPGAVESMDLLYRTPVSFGLILWSGWFPLVVAAVAAIIAIVGPARRVRPTTLDEWTPPGAVTPAPPPALGVVPASGTSATTTQTVSSTAPYGGTAAGSTSVLPETRPAPYGRLETPPPTTRPDAPPTMPMPGSEGRPLYSGGQDTLNLGLTDRPSTPEPSDGALPRRPEAERVTTPHATTAGSTATTTADEPSWLAAPLSTGRTDPALDRRAEERDSLIKRSEASTLEQPIADAKDEGTVTCPRCGSREFRSAAFCTQCGNRLQAP